MVMSFNRGNNIIVSKFSVCLKKRLTNVGKKWVKLLVLLQ